jgi:hypothetical protein
MRPHGSDGDDSSWVAGVEPGRAKPPDPGLARRGLARRGGLDPSHPVFVTSKVLTLNDAHDAWYGA